MNILVDTSVWIDHLHRASTELRETLESGAVVTHSAVIGELACGNMANRAEVLSLVKLLPRISEISGEEALDLVESRKLWGRGLGWTDVHLLGSCLLNGTALWTRDKRLHAIANKTGVKLARA